MKLEISILTDIPKFTDSSFFENLEKETGLTLKEISWGGDGPNGYIIDAKYDNLPYPGMTEDEMKKFKLLSLMMTSENDGLSGMLGRPIGYGRI